VFVAILCGRTAVALCHYTSSQEALARASQLGPVPSEQGILAYSPIITSMRRA
jgi:hypothetical protein